MSETRFLSCLLTEGFFLTILGILTLIIPKITHITFGFMLCFAFISYGGYRAINSVMLRNFSKYFILSLISGVLLLVAGILLLFAPVFDVTFVIAVLAVYFISESISTSAVLFRARNILKCKYTGHILSVFQFFAGFFVIVVLPSTALWLAGVLAGIDFLLSGVIILNIYLASNYKY